VKRRKEESYRTILRKKEQKRAPLGAHGSPQKRKKKEQKIKGGGTAPPELESFYPSRRK